MTNISQATACATACGLGEWEAGLFLVWFEAIICFIKWNVVKVFQELFNGENGLTYPNLKARLICKT